MLENYVWSDSQRFLLTQHMETAGLNDVHMLFMRDKAIDMWNQLEWLKSNTTRISCIIQGSPGMGKSSVAWAWACNCACKKEKLLWLHLDTGYCKMVVLNGPAIQSHTFFDNEKFTDLVSLAIDTSISDNNTIIIVDGIGKNNNPSLGYFYVLADKGWRVIFITSDSYHINLDTRLNWVRFHVYSWTLEEYTTACEHQPFYETVKSNFEESVVSVTDEGEKKKMKCFLEDKFFLAGHCARWFFSLDYERAIDALDYHLMRVKNCADYVKDLIGNRSEESINHLLSSFGSTCSCIVSEYAVRFITLKCHNGIISAFLMQPAVKKNPSFQGWVVELAFLERLRTEEEIKVYSVENEEKWKVNGLNEDIDPKNIEKNLLNAGWCIPKWIRCLSTNNER